MSSDLRERLQTTLGTAYTLERELGGGGMSRVFLAEESRLGRKVVVKVLSSELAAGVSADRFEREIVLAARLSHPSIVPVLTAGESEGLPYYTMPYVEGESLRARLSTQGPLSITEAVGVLRDVARALAYAHEHGTVHRDIKPENVLLSGDAAVVTDFGIAKAISAARTETPDATITRAGTMMGTPAYMAPEQVAGDPQADARVDLYAWGCLAYELLTGETPFHGRPAHKVFIAHLSEKPMALQPRCLECPAELAALVMQCLEKEPDRRPRSVREILPVLDAVLASPIRPSGQSAARRRGVSIAVAVGLLLTVAAVRAIVSRARSTGAGDTTAQSGTTIRSMAVLPFQNLGGDTSDAYFADGMAEELATALSKVPGLRLVARSSAFRMGGRAVNVQQAGRELAVDALLDGTVRRAGDQMRLTVRLTRVGDESVLWSERYDRQVKDVFAVQDEMARSIVSALRVHLADASRLTASGRTASGAGAGGGTSDIGAYDLYLRAQYLLRRRGPGVRQAADKFEQAIRLDSNFARAYSGLSAALELFPYFGGSPAADVYDRAVAAARRALALDSSLAEAHTSLAMAYQHAYQWSPAEQEFAQALAADPNDAANRHQYGRFLLYTGRPREALEQLRQAKVLDPYSAVISSWLGYNLLIGGETDSAVAETKRAIELDSTNATAVTFEAFTRLKVGDKAGARATINRLTKTLPWAGTVAYVLGRLGDTSAARRIVRDLEAQQPRQWFAESAIAMGSLGLGDTARALDALERATTAREVWPTFWPVLDDMFRGVRASSRFAALGKRIGLDVSRSAAPTGPRR